MTSRPAKQESHREHQHTHLLQCQTTQDRAENPRGRGGSDINRSKVLASKADPQVWSQGRTGWKGRVDSCELWHTSAHSQTHKVPKGKGGKGRPRVPKPGKGFCRHGGFSSSHSEHGSTASRRAYTSGDEPSMAAQALSQTDQAASHLGKTRCGKCPHYPKLPWPSGVGTGLGVHR